MTTDERLAVLEADKRNIFHQLDEMKEEIKVLRELAAAVAQLADKTESNTTLLRRVDSRLDALELKPAENFNHYKRFAVTALISSLLGAAVTALCTGLF